MDSPREPTSAAGARLSTVSGRAGARLRTLSRLTYMAYVCRVPLIAAVVVLLAGLPGEQIQEVVRVYLLDLAEDGAQAMVLSKLACIYFGLFLLAWTQLFWGRYALANRFPPALAHNSVLRAALASLPIVLATLPWLGAAAAMAKAGAALQGEAHTLAQLGTWASALVGAGSIAAYHTPRRRQAIRYRPDRATQGFGQRDWIVASLGLGLALFIAAALAPQIVGTWLGTIGVLLAACVALVPVLSWLTAASRIPRWHWLTLLAGLAVLWSALDLNDNHALREMPVRQEAPKLLAYGEAVRQWLTSRVPPQAPDGYPMVFVAAEGGGIRAAYFTAQVLSAIQDRCPAFAQHLFLVSGVSGGSVGAATFAGLLDAAGTRDARDPLPCTGEVAGVGDFAKKSEAVLKTDYLGPLVATFLFPDALQRFLPFSVATWDRARTLEETVESSFSAQVGTDFMARSVYDYWRPDANVPILMLNATNVESGHRTVASPAYPLEERFHRLATFQDFQPSGDFRISTMAVTSARFPVVTPAATIGTGESKLRFVDGGYFENSGAATLAEAIDVAMQTAAQHRISIRPVVIRIGNSPSMLAAAQGVRASDEAKERDWKGLGELLSPVRAMVNTRSARGVLAAEVLKTVVTTMQDNGAPSDYVEFQIGVDAIPIPLGWQLASTTRRALVAQLGRPADCSTRHGIVNGCSVVDVIDAIRGWQLQ